MSFSFTESEKEIFGEIFDKYDEPGECTFNRCIAEEGCTIDTLIWLQENGRNWDIHATYFAAKGGSLEVMKWLKKEGCPWYKHAICGALNYPELVRWMIVNGAPMNEDIIRYYANDNNLEVIKFLKEQGCPIPLDADLITTAAESGNLEFIKWLKLNGCPWNYRAISRAAENGHLETVVWLVQNDCPLHQEAMGWARKNGHLHISEWIRMYGCSPG